MNSGYEFLKTDFNGTDIVKNIIFNDSIQHLKAELRRLEILIDAKLLQMTLPEKTKPLDLSNFAILREEVTSHLKTTLSDESSTSRPLELLSELETLQENYHQAEAMLTEQVKNSLAKGVFLRLVWLAQTYQLSTIDFDILLLSLAPAVDLKYQLIYSYLQGDAQKKFPTVDLILELLCCGYASNWMAKQEARRRFSINMPLLKHKLIYLMPDSNQSQLPLLAKSIQVDERVIEYLLDSDELDARLIGFTRKVFDRPSILSCLFAEDKQSILAFIKKTQMDQQKNTILYLQAPAGMGKQTLVTELCQTLDITLLQVNMAELLATQDFVRFKQTIDLLLRELVLQRAAVYWQSFDLLLELDKRFYLEYFLTHIDQQIGLHFFGGNHPWEPAIALSASCFLRITIPALNTMQREKLWQQLQQQSDTSCEKNIDLIAIADRYRLTPEQIQAAWQTAVQLSIQNDLKKPILRQQDLQQACQLHSSPNLQNLAVNIVPRYYWEDIVLPEHSLLQLAQMRDQLQHQHLVYEQWGFADKLGLTKGIYALFTGPPGTGKTMAAEILANELGLLLYKIDLSSIVNKYVGETEKNLERVFSEAEASNVILFFDEADALFGKRSEIQDAHDRYANIEVSYLLQRLETYSGIVVLASNFRGNIDEAFVRRLHFSIEFPLPDAAERTKIWRAIWPQTVSQESLNIDLLAQRFDISGASIRNIALNAAFFATAISKTKPEINMQHIFRAVQLEYQKMGRLILLDEFNLSQN